MMVGRGLNGDCDVIATGKNERAGLRHAVASNIGTLDAEFSRQAAHAGPHLLLIANGFWHLSSPGRASAIAVEELRRLDARTDAAGLTAALEQGLEGLRVTYRRLLAGDHCWEGTGARLTAMLWRDTHAAIAHIGDTRAYLLRGGTLTQLTRDHTLGQLLLEAGEISAGELGADSRHYSVVRWLDGESGETADITAHEAATGDRYVLCAGQTDRVMSPATLRDILADTVDDPREAADEIAGMAFPLQRYGEFTCIVADVVAREG